MKYLYVALLCAMLGMLGGCDGGKVNTVLPRTAVVDAIYAPHATEWINAKLGKPKTAKTIVMTYWHDEAADNYSNRGIGYMSLVIDGAEKIRPVDNVGGYDYSASRGFKFAYDGRKWMAYVAEDEVESHENIPELYFNDVLAVLAKY